ncbi:hypothetical protein [Neolewinella persica]|uniref:hypothetical protein n=1 Tax=Neolewinella persica TaxID=70998 RepID=UPI0003764AEA|nr:hypothetical protein [Neolewinella persica]
MKSTTLQRGLCVFALCLLFASVQAKDCLTPFNVTVNQALDEAHESVRECSNNEPYAIAHYCELEVAVLLNHNINNALDSYDNCLRKP